MRALPLSYLTQDELTRSVHEVVLDNPNHVKELLFNCGLSAYRLEDVMRVLKNAGGYHPDELNSLQERGVIQSSQLDQLRMQFNQPPHVPLVQFTEMTSSQLPSASPQHQHAQHSQDI